MPDLAQEEPQVAPPLPEYEPPAPTEAEVEAVRKMSPAEMALYAEGCNAAFALLIAPIPGGVLEVNEEGRFVAFVPGVKQMGELIDLDAQQREMFKILEERGTTYLGPLLAFTDQFHKHLQRVTDLVELVGLIAKIIDVLTPFMSVTGPLAVVVAAARLAAKVLAPACETIAYCLKIIDAVLLSVRAGLSAWQATWALMRGDENAERYLLQAFSDVLEFGTAAWAASQERRARMSRKGAGDGFDAKEEVWFAEGDLMTARGSGEFRGDEAKDRAPGVDWRGAGRALWEKGVTEAYKDLASEEKGGAALLSATLKPAIAMFRASANAAPAPTGQLSQQKEQIAGQAERDVAAALRERIPDSGTRKEAASPEPSPARELVAHVIAEEPVIRMRRIRIRQEDARLAQREKEERTAAASLEEEAKDLQEHARRARGAQSAAVESRQKEAQAAEQARTEAATGLEQRDKVAESADGLGAAREQAASAPDLARPPEPQDWLDRLINQAIEAVDGHIDEFEQRLISGLMAATGSEQAAQEMATGLGENAQGFQEREEAGLKSAENLGALAQQAEAEAEAAEASAAEAQVQAEAARQTAEEIAAQRAELAAEEEELAGREAEAEATIAQAVDALTQEGAGGEGGAGAMDPLQVQALARELSSLAQAVRDELIKMRETLVTALVEEARAALGDEGEAAKAGQEFQQDAEKATSEPLERLQDIPADLQELMGSVEAGMEGALAALAQELDVLREAALKALANLAREAEEELKPLWERNAAAEEAAEAGTQAEPPPGGGPDGKESWGDFGDPKEGAEKAPLVEQPAGIEQKPDRALA